MKKLLSALLFVSLIVSALCLTVFAGDADFNNDNGFVIASYNGVNTFVKDDSRLSEIEDSTYWIAEMKDTYNIKYVSFIGQIATKCQYNYANTVTSQGLTTDQLTSMSLNDPAWNAQYKNFAKAISFLKDENLPVGVSGTTNDYVGQGFNRNNLISDYLSHEELMPDDVNGGSLDDNNYYTIVENNGTKYIIFQLEIWPRTTTLDWFNSIMDQNPDKYAIICTPYLIDDTGALYTMWSWETTGFQSIGTTRLRYFNMTWYDKPRDGEELWKYSFGKYDNILAVITQSYEVDGIVMSKIKNDRGIEVAAISANADISMNNNNGVTLLLTKISADNTEITCAWSVAFKGIIESSEKSVKLSKIGTLTDPIIDDSLPKISTQYNGANNSYILGYEENTFRPNANMTRAEACTIFARLLLGVNDIPDGYTTRFTDVKEGDWYYNAIAYLDETGYFFRNKNTEYKPNEPITRAEFVELANLTSSLTGNSTISFTDVPEDHFYYDSIVAAAASGLVNGYEDNTFRPDNTITRAEVVTVINRLLGLKVSENTISETHLENEFTDIGTHWARLNILMASNSNVHGDYYYEASLDGVTENSVSYKLTNKHFSMTILKKNGKISELINLDNSENVVMGTGSQFIYITTDNGRQINPTKLETEGNRIKVTFKGGYVVYLLVEVCDDYMTFEIDSELAPGIACVVFANIATSLPAATDDNSYMINAIGMTAWTNPVNKGYNSQSATQVVAKAYSIYDAGTMGAKLGVVFAKRGDTIKYLQEVMDAIDPTVGLTSKAGGAYALEWEGNMGDYGLISNVNPDTIDDVIDLAFELDLDQLDIHQSASGTFRQGDFVFAYTENGTAKEYYENVGKKIADAGIKTGLHTYAYYIDYNASTITADPYWQKQLEKRDDVYTLRKKITKFRTTIPTEEDASGFDNTYTFFYKNSRYILIDEEIIWVQSGTTEGFIGAKRGQCGTDAVEHLPGATIYHLSGYFNMFVPVLGSELFYHIADLTAQAYNDGGFDMIYLDAIDGLSRHLADGEETWYYFHMFVQRIVSQCDRDPILETSSGAPQEWNVRGRTGAWDTASRSLKLFISNHIETNKASMNNNMATTLGWFSFFPDQSPVAGLKNTIQKTIFHDDLDVLGMGGILYDMSVVFNPFSVDSIKNNAFHYSNAKYYTEYYSKLRKSDYFTDEVIEKVKSIGGEWKVIEKSEGEYALLQMYYEKANLGSAKDTVLNSYSGSNPYSSQTPFIRIESRYSTLFENPVLIASFNEEKTLAEQTLTNITVDHVDLTPNMAMSIRVKGTGKDGDAALISLAGGVTSGESGGRTDYFIDLNFTGWREIVLLDADNAEYDVDKYTFSGITTSGATYATFRVVTAFTDIVQVNVRLCGSTASNAQFGDLVAYTHTDAPIENPTIKVGNSSMTFNCKMSGGEYLEYDPLTNKAILYHNSEQTTEEVTFTGTLNVDKGAFTATYTADAKTNAPTRARITLGFAGQEITN